MATIEDKLNALVNKVETMSHRLLDFGPSLVHKGPVEIEMEAYDINIFHKFYLLEPELKKRGDTGWSIGGMYRQVVEGCLPTSKLVIIWQRRK